MDFKYTWLKAPKEKSRVSLSLTLQVCLRHKTILYPHQQGEGINPSCHIDTEILTYCALRFNGQTDSPWICSPLNYFWYQDGKMINMKIRFSTKTFEKKIDLTVTCSISVNFHCIYLSLFIWKLSYVSLTVKGLQDQIRFIAHYVVCANHSGWANAMTCLPFQTSFFQRKHA